MNPRKVEVMILVAKSNFYSRCAGYHSHSRKATVKARFLKSSIILPIGNYVAGIHPLQIAQQVYGTDQHGLCKKDLNPERSKSS